MLREGQRVTTLTKKAGQAPRVGTVRAVRDGFVEVEWDDGRRSTVTVDYLMPFERKRSKVST